MLFPIKVCLLGLAFMVAYLIRIHYVNPKVLEPLCLLNTSKCIKIEYYLRDNSLFAYVTPSAFQIWFNGTSFYVYDLSASTGRMCSDPNYQPAYEIQLKRSAVQNYSCIRSIKEVMKYYADTPKRYAYVRSPKAQEFSAFDVIRFFVDKQIIALPPSKPSSDATAGR